MSDKETLGRRVSVEEMISAYQELIQAGEKPTAMRLFRALGRGSYYTCTKFLEKTESERRFVLSGQQMVSCGDESPYFVGSAFSTDGRVPLLLPEVLVMLDAGQIASLLEQEAARTNFVEISGATVRISLVRTGANILTEQLRSMTAFLNGAGRNDG